MQDPTSKKQIYIVISQTGTLLSRILKFVTGKEYNHASISLTGDLNSMYSFGRLNPYNPFFGGFVQESPYYGTFKRFSNTKIVVLAVDIDDSQYREIRNTINMMRRSKSRYHYNYLGLCLAAFNIPFTSSDRYYCSEFVKHILCEGKIEGSEELGAIVHPMSFLSIPDAEVIYSGKLSEYSFHPRLSLNTYLNT